MERAARAGCLIGIVASANLGAKAGPTRWPTSNDRWVILGLLGVVAGTAWPRQSCSIVAWRFAGRIERALRLTVVGGFVLAGRRPPGHRHGPQRAYDRREPELRRGRSASILTGAVGLLRPRAGLPADLLGGAYAILGPGPTAGELLNLVLRSARLGGRSSALLQARAQARARPCSASTCLRCGRPARSSRTFDCPRRCTSP